MNNAEQLEILTGLGFNNKQIEFMEVGIAYNQTNFFFTTSIQRLETYGLPHGVNIDNYIRQIITTR